MSDFYRVIGVDPSLTHTGLAVVDSPRPNEYRVVVYDTITTHSRDDMLERLRHIGDATKLFLNRTIAGCKAIAVEDPTAQIKVRTKNQRPRDIAVMSVAVGVVLAMARDVIHTTTALECDPSPTLAFVPVETWMPTTTSGNFRHILKKTQLSMYLLDRITVPRGAGEHVVMAAGVARYWIDNERLRVKREAQGIKL